MSVLVYDCGSVENTVTAILDTESGAMIIRGSGDIDNYADESSPWYSEHSDILQVTVDKGITRLGSGTFYGCENLSFVEIASTVTSIGADVFQNCTSLTSIKIPKSITDIGNGTFADSGLTEVKFYGNPPTVGTDIFDGVTADVYTPEGNEEWTETAKGTVAGNGSNLTWKTFDSKPNLIEYDELDYFWSKIKKWVNDNKSDSSLPIIDDKTFIKYLTSVISDSNHTNMSTTLYVNNPEYFSVNDCFYVKKDSTHFFYGIVSAVNNNTGALTYSIPVSDGGTFFSPDDGQVVLNYGNVMNGGVYLDWANDRIDLYKNHKTFIENDYNIYEPILNINAWDSTTADIAEEDGVVDISGEDNHGQAYGGVRVVTDKVDGRIFDFDGTDDYLDIPNTISTSLKNKDGITLVVNIKLEDTPSSNSCIISGSVGTSYMVGLQIHTDRTISSISRVDSASDTAKRIDSQSAIPLNQNVNLIAVYNYDAGLMYLYIDGTLAGQAECYSTPLSIDLDSLTIGAKLENGSLTQQFNGQISFIRIFDKALTSQEIQNIYRQSSITQYLNSNIYEPMLNLDTNYSTTSSIAEINGVVDVSGHNNHGQASDLPQAQLLANDNGFDLSGGGYIEFPQSVAESFGNLNGITLSVRAKIVLFRNTMYLFLIRFSDKIFSELSIIDSNPAVRGRRVYDDNIVIAQSNIDVNDNAYHTITGVFDFINGKIIIYVDGAYANDADLESKGVSGVPVTVWISYNYGNKFYGELTNIRAYPRVLSAKEVADIHKQSVNPEAFKNPDRLIPLSESELPNFMNDSLVQDTLFRVGNLNGILDINDGRPGVFIGDENEYIKFDKVNGLKINATVQNAQIANQIGNTSIGNSTSPIYLNNGVPTACNINIGGRNIARGTTTMTKGGGTWASGTWRDSNAGTTYNVTISDSPISSLVNKGVTITLTTSSNGGFAQDTVTLVDSYITMSCWVKGTAGSNILLQPFYSSSLGAYNKSFTLNGEWQYLSCTGKVPTVGTYSIGYCYLQTANSTVSIIGIKVEYGTVPSTWTPAPEDAVNRAILANTVLGSYTSNGGKQNPNYFGVNKVGFLMMNTTVNSNTQYKDWILMDCYGGSDVGGGVAFGVNRQALGAYIMRSAAARESWAESAELIGTHNYTSYTVKKDGTGASGSWGISVTGNAATATTATNTNNAKLTHTVGNTEYPLVFGTSFVITDAQQALRIGTPTATAANCALRCKSYCAAANTQGEAYLVCGNNLAKASANNARGSIYLYGTSTAHTQIVPGNNSTSNVVITLPASTGTLALTSSNITGSSASCTGNAATATTASACSGNAASSTYATNIRVTDTDSNTWYPLVFSTGSAASTNYAARVDADSILVYPGTAPAANTQGYCYMQLGNGKAKATAGNKRGVLRIYGTGTAYTEITSAVESTARSISFPDKAGTVALTSDIPALSWCTTKATTTSSASSTKPSVIIANYVSGSTWAVKFSDGLKIQGGTRKQQTARANEQVSYTAIYPFSDTNYVLMAMPHLDSTNAPALASLGNTKTTTSFKVFQADNTTYTDWIAFGY